MQEAHTKLHQCTTIFQGFEGAKERGGVAKQWQGKNGSV